MKGSLPPETAHRTVGGRPPDLSTHDKAGPRAPRPHSAIPVGDSDPLTDLGNGPPAAGCERPFGDHALPLSKRGLAVVPCGGEDGKSPKVREWQKRKWSLSTIAELARRYPDANIGVACGLSGIVVVDVDDPTLIPAMLLRFGDTPLITRTPSGGSHLWYRKAGVVGSGPLGPSLAVDIKADGGQVIVPPSFNPQSGKEYVFERGSWDDLDRLPPFRQEALPRPKTSAKSSRPPKSPASSGTVGEGLRDKTVFFHAMREAPHVTSEHDLIAVMQTFNVQHCSPPLPARQVGKIAKSAWRYEERGENLIGHAGGGVVPHTVGKDLLSRPHGEDALALLYILKWAHGGRAEPFAVCAKAMARDRVIPQWGDPRRYTRAVKILVAQRVLRRVSPSRRGARGHWTPAQYTFTGPGASIAPNITIHPSPPLPH
jgi:hypothetical protein